MTNDNLLTANREDALAQVRQFAEDRSNESTHSLENALHHPDSTVARAAATALLKRDFDKAEITRIEASLDVSDLCSRCGKATVPRSAYEGQIGSVMMGDGLSSMLEAQTAARYVCRRCKAVHCIECSSAYPCRTPFCRNNLFDSV